MLSKQVFAALTGLTIGLAAQSQEEMVVSVDEVSPGSWELSAELLNPGDPLEVAVASLKFHLEGSGIAEFDYNPAFDSEFFGPAVVNVTDSTIDFFGINTPGPLQNPDGPDMSNPLFIARFDALTVESFTIQGYFDGASQPAPGSQFPQIILYQNINGSPGDVPYRIEINPIPAPASGGVLLAASCMVARRRR